MKIGIAGARGLSTLMGFRAIEGCEIRALCDLNADLLGEQSQRHGIPETYRVFEDMLLSDIDAVVVATPMQCHVPQAIAALAAGKHVLSEVTAGVTMDELWWLREAVEASGKIYMFAENYCYTPENRIVREMAARGLFGDPYYAEGEYLHNVRSLAKYPDGSDSWRKYWQLGKRGCFYPTHSLGPVMQWFGEDRVTELSCFTAGHHNFAPGLSQDDTTVTMLKTERGRLITLRVDCMSPRPHNMTGYQLQGTRGAYESARAPGGKNLVWLDRFGEDADCAKWRDLSEFGEYLPARYQAASDEQKKAGHGGGDFFLVEDFVNAVRAGTPPEIDVYRACEWTAVGLLSEISVMNGGRAVSVPDFRRARSVADKETRL